LLFVNCGSLEMAIVVRCASQICLVVAAYALYAMGEPILRLASRLLDIPAPGE
jgi:hypothetical protein